MRTGTRANMARTSDVAARAQIFVEKLVVEIGLPLLCGRQALAGALALDKGRHARAVHLGEIGADRTRRSPRRSAPSGLGRRRWPCCWHRPPAPTPAIVPGRRLPIVQSSARSNHLPPPHPPHIEETQRAFHHRPLWRATPLGCLCFAAAHMPRPAASKPCSGTTYGCARISTQPSGNVRDVGKHTASAMAAAVWDRDSQPFAAQASSLQPEEA